MDINVGSLRISRQTTIRTWRQIFLIFCYDVTSAALACRMAAG